MKITFAAILISVFSVFCFAQDNSIEKDFEKNKSKYKIERLSMGEDASSGYDYVIYRNKSEIVKYRVIWSSSAGPNPRVEDYYFNDSKLVLLVKSILSKKLVKTAAKGRVVALQIEEKLFFINEKLSFWTEKGKPVPNTDKRWKDKEAEALEQAKGELDNYKFVKDN